jgi:HSP20 family protein
MPNFIILRRLPRNRLGALQRELERDWLTRWSRPRPAASGTNFWRPNADVHEHADAYLIKIELAGMRDTEIEVTVDEGQLVVSGQRSELRDNDVECVHELGINYGPFQLEFSLTVPLQDDAITARYDDGILYITLPKRPAQPREPRRITIQVDESTLTPQ